MPQHAAAYGNRLRMLMDEPEMLALLAAGPQAARLLRPLFRMLGHEREMPAILRLPERAKSERAKPERAKPERAEPARPRTAPSRPAVPPSKPPAAEADAAGQGAREPATDPGSRGHPFSPSVPEPPARPILGLVDSAFER
jgi:hypothetical protein